jgi:uncharacterized Fe-S center protein
MVMNHKAAAGDDNAPLIEGINSRHGIHTIDWAEHIGLGTKNYLIIKL